MAARNQTQRSPRAEVDWPVMIESSQGSMDGKLQNISAAGAFICCQEPVESGETFAMAIIIPKLDGHIMLSARVIRDGFHCLDAENMAYGIGVEFTRISAEDRELIVNLVGEHRKSE